MKIITKTLMVLSAIAMVPLASANENPTGEISADSQLVLAGSYPKLDWNITYPSSIETIVTITPPGEIIPKTDLTMQVRTLAADVQERREYWNGWKWVTSYRYIKVTGYGRVNSQSWRLLFNNYQPYVNPASIVWQKDLDEGDEVIFAARADYSGLPWYYSGQSDHNVVLLTDGQTPPTYATWDTQSTLGTHIAPYLDANGAVDIGPRDVIVAFELTHDMTPGAGSGGGDMQDMLFLVTFQTEEN